MDLSSHKFFLIILICLSAFIGILVLPDSDNKAFLILTYMAIISIINHIKLISKFGEGITTEVNSLSMSILGLICLPVLLLGFYNTRNYDFLVASIPFIHAITVYLIYMFHKKRNGINGHI